MKFFRLDLLTLLISLFILNGCKNPDSIGLDVDPGDQLSGTLVTDSNVTLNTVLEDSVVAVNQGRTPLGVFNDPEFGLTEANIITDINLPGRTTYTVPIGTIKIDSAILQLRYTTNGFYGDSLNSVYKVDVYKVSEKPSITTTPYSNKQWSPTGIPFGSKTFVARPHDTLSVNAIIKGAPDTLTRVLPQVRIKLDPDRVYGMLFETPSTIKSNPAFQNANNGFYITIDKAASTGTGGIMTFVTDSVIIYSRVTASSGTIDTTITVLPIDGNISQIKHTYSTNITDAINSTTTSNPKVYIQGMGGLRAKVKFPDFKTSLPKNVVINRAELVLTPVAGTVTPYAPLPALMLYKLDLAKQRTVVEDAVDQNSGYGSLFGGYFGFPIKNEYHFLITTYMQNLLSNKTKDYGVYIGATNENATSVSVSPQAYPIQRTILYGKNSPYRAKLNIIYTILK